MSNGVRGTWKAEISKTAAKCENYLSAEFISWIPNSQKTSIDLSSDDPTLFGTLKTSKETTNSILQTIIDGKNNGYAPSVGYDYARQAVADFVSCKGIDIESKDVILCSGCSSALDLSITVLVDGSKNQNILIPKPSSNSYRILSESLGIKIKEYGLLEEYNWKVDLFDLEGQIDSNTAAVLINNPSNPCGSVYSQNHLREILEICFRKKIPVIADESYSQLVFDGEFYSVGSIGTRVPILICGGISKGFLVPGWRLGWILICDPIGAFESVRKGLISLTQRIIGCNTVVQGSLTGILHTNPDSFNEDMVHTLKENAKFACEVLQIDGLKPYMPQGTIFMMVKIEMEKFKLQSSFQFVKRLYEEEAVLCLPSELFGLTGFMRISITPPFETLREVAERITEFCIRHYK